MEAGPRPRFKPPLFSATRLDCVDERGGFFGVGLNPAVLDNLGILIAGDKGINAFLQEKSIEKVAGIFLAPK